MTVYVDDMKRPAQVVGTYQRMVWSHLTADTERELNEFASRIGLKPEWIQYPGTYKFHYDVNATKRVAAIRAGAKRITYFEFGRMIAARNSNRQGAKK